MENFNFEKDMYIFYVNRKLEIITSTLEVIHQEIKQALVNNPSDLRGLAILTQILYNYKLDYKEAIKIIKQILVVDPLNLDARIDLVEVMFKFKLKKPNECYQILDECETIDNSYWRINFVRSVILSENMNVDDSILILKRLQDQQPDNIFVLSRLSQFLSENEYSQKESKKLLQKVKQNKIYDYDILRRLSYTEFSLKNYDECKKLLERAIQLNPNSSISYENLAYYELKISNNQQKGEELYLKSIQHDENVYEAYSQLANINLQRNNTAEAIKYLKKCIELRGNRSPSPYTELAMIYNNEKQYDLSYYYIQKARRIFETCPYINMIAVMQRSENPFKDTYQDKEEDEFNSHTTINQSIQTEFDYTYMNSFITIIY